MGKNINSQKIEDALKKLRFRYQGLTLYNAGVPRFERPFTRDTVISALLSNDPQMLSGILKFAALKQGTKKDAVSGEEQGKIFHEFDIKQNNAGQVRGRPGHTKLYNACDTTALFLLGHNKYLELTDDLIFTKTQFSNIALACDYILRHLNKQNEFAEDPTFSDAREYALKVTYWKDSVVVDRKEGEPVFPVVYPLAHIQNLAGLRAGAELLNSDYLLQKAQDMKNALLGLFDKDINNFPVAVDSKGKISAVSSDGLDALFYLRPGDLDDSFIGQIIESSKILETKLGYRSLEEEACKRLDNQYHGRVVWTHEQALVHAGATKHLRWALENKNIRLAGLLNRVREVSFRIYKYLEANPGSFPEIFDIKEGKIIPSGCNPQLWAIAAKKYFMDYSAYRQEKETVANFLN